MPSKSKKIISGRDAALNDKDYQNLLKDLQNIISSANDKTAKHSRGLRNLGRQKKATHQENTPKKEIHVVFQTKQPAIRLREVFKDTYDFEFIEFQPDSDEEELEDKILSNFGKFLHELGEDFSFIGRQVPIQIDRQTQFIDMVLYHRGIPCTVLVSLKIGKLGSGDIIQMNKLTGYWRRHKQYGHEQPTIGLIICRETGREEVIYALEGLEDKIFIAKYKVKLPSEAKIKKAIRDL